MLRRACGEHSVPSCGPLACLVCRGLGATQEQAPRLTWPAGGRAETQVHDRREVRRAGGVFLTEEESWLVAKEEKEDVPRA